jgi:hypothetical protein
VVDWVPAEGRGRFRRDVPVWLGAVSPDGHHLARRTGREVVIRWRYRERLTVPLLWWLLAAGFAGTLLVAIGAYAGPVWGIGVAAASLAVATGIFLSAATVIIVEPGRLRVGRGVIEAAYIAGAIPLDAEQTRRRSGVDADARAHLVLRPYIRTAVEITLIDPADPVPYWLVSSRRPAELAAAVGHLVDTRLAE